MSATSPSSGSSRSPWPTSASSILHASFNHSLRGRGLKIAERADRPLAWSFRCLNRFRQQVVGVRLDSAGPRRPADVHASLRIADRSDRANQSDRKRKYRPQLVTILPNHAPTSGSPKQFQRLATDRTCPAVKKSPQKMEVGLNRPTSRQPRDIGRPHVRSDAAVRSDLRPKR